MSAAVGTVPQPPQLPASTESEVLGAWSAAKGSLAVRQGGLMTGESVLSLQPSTLAVDANGRFVLDTAIAYAKMLRDYPLGWYEAAGDPLDSRLQAALARRTGR